MDLSRNNLSGQIPRYLEAFPFLEKLNLSFNNLEGEISKEGIFRNVSAISVLGNSKLCGGIPQLQLSMCHIEAAKKERSDALKIIIPTTSVALFLILLVCIFATSYCKRKLGQKHSSTPFSEDRHLKLSYQDLLKSTNGFSPANLIGEGNYGSVYKGTLDRERMVVAVKVFKIHQEGAFNSFTAECNALRNIRHRNLIKCLTSCSSLDYDGNDFKALVLQFMPNGNLDEWLHQKADDQRKLRHLNLIQRLNIALDVASALDYLHHHCQTPIIHCDLKPSNVLLDDEMSAHVGDFGLARILSGTAGNSSQGQTSLVKGTVGYVAPEYGIGGKVSTHGDAYSYGILLLEMFTGRRPTDDLFKEGLSLHEFSKVSFPNRVMEIVDPTLFLEEEGVEHAGSSEIQRCMNGRMKNCLVSLIEVGLSCSVGSPGRRMNMRDVIKEMLAIKDLFLNC